MKEFSVEIIYKKPGEMDDLKVRAFQLEVGDRISADDEESWTTKDEFFKVLDKASQPVKKHKDKKNQQG